jgi:hypothetical protein
MHLFLFLLPVRLLLLHFPDHKVESLPIPIVLLLLPPSPLLVAEHLSAQFLPYLRAALLGLLTAQEAVTCHRDPTRRLIVLGEGAPVIVIVEREACREGALHRVIEGLSDLTALPVLHDLAVKGRFIGDHGLSFEFISQFILLFDCLHHIGKVLPLFKLGGTHFFEFLVGT